MFSSTKRQNAFSKITFVISVMPLFTACLSTGVRSAGSELPQAATTFGDGRLSVSVKHNCDERCESMTVDFENQTTSPMEIVVNQARLMRGAEKFGLRRLGEETGNLRIPPKDSASAKFAPYSSSSGRRLSYVAPKAVWCSMKVHSDCSKTTHADAQCAGYARSYFDVYTEAGGWISLNFTYNLDGRIEVVQSPAPETLGRGPDVVPKPDDRAPAFFRNPDDVVFYKMECNEKCRCSDLTKPRRFSDDKLKPVVEPIP